MTVEIRLLSTDVKALDQAETALRTVLDIPAPASDYPSRRTGDPTVRRFLKADGLAEVMPARPPRPAPLAVADDAKQRRDILGELGALATAHLELTKQPWYPIRPGDVVLSFLPGDKDFPPYGQTYLAVEGTSFKTDVDGNAFLREVARTDPPGNGEPTTDSGDVDYVLCFDSAAGHWLLKADLGRAGISDWQRATQLTAADAVGEAQLWAAARVEEVEDNTVTAWRWQADAGWIPEMATEQPDPGLDSGEQLTDFYELWFETGPDRIVVIRAGAIVHGSPAHTTRTSADMVGAGK